MTSAKFLHLNHQQSLLVMHFLSILLKKSFLKINFSRKKGMDPFEICWSFTTKSLLYILRDFYSGYFIGKFVFLFIFSILI